MEGAITLMNLYEKTSAAGRKYFVGALNGNRVLVMRNDKAEIREGDDPVWSVFVKPKEAPASQARSSYRSQPRPRREPRSPSAEQPDRASARPARAKPSTAQAKAIADINARYRSDLNDPVGEL